jgi:uncharacterized protein (DUF885 family)
MVTATPEANRYYSPVKTFPATFSEGDKQLLTAAYTAAVRDKVIPMNRRMADFLRTEYLPKARTTSGYGSLPRGRRILQA